MQSGSTFTISFSVYSSRHIQQLVYNKLELVLKISDGIFAQLIWFIVGLFRAQPRSHFSYLPTKYKN